MNHRWQSEPTDGPKDAWSCVCGSVAVVAMFAVVTSPQLLGVVRCSAVAVLVVA